MTGPLVLTPEQQQVINQVGPAPAIPGATTGAPQIPPPSGATALGAAPQSQTTDQTTDQMPGEVPNNPPNPLSGYFGSQLQAAVQKPENNIPLTLAQRRQQRAGQLIGVAQSLLGGLADAAAATQNVKAGQGWLSGIEKTMAARSQRLSAQQAEQHKEQMEDEENRRANEAAAEAKQKSQLDTAEANARMQKQQDLAYQTGYIDPLIAQGQNQIKMLTEDVAHPTPIVASGVTYDEIQKGVISGKWNTHDYTAIVTGKKPALDKNGNPTFTLLYDVVPVGGEVKPNADEIKYLNDNHATDQPIPEGTKFTFSQWNSLHQTADDNATHTAARNKFLVDNNMTAKNLEVTNFGPVWSLALVSAHGDPAAAVKSILSNPQMVAKYPNIYNDVRQNYGPENFDKWVQDRQKAASSDADSLNTFLNDPTKMDSPGKADSVYAMADSKAKDPTTPKDQLPGWAAIRNRANQVRTLTAEDKQKADADVSPAGTIPGNLQGDAFLAQVQKTNPAYAITLQSLHDGNYPINKLDYIMRGDKGKIPPVVNDLSRAFPNDRANFQDIPAFVKAYMDFGTGHVAEQIKNLNNAIDHASRLDSNLSKVPPAARAALAIPGGASEKIMAQYGLGNMREIQADAARLAEEIQQAYGSGKTDKQMENTLQSLNGNTIGAIQEGERESVRLLADLANNTAAEWRRTAPSDAWHPPRAILGPSEERYMNQIAPGAWEGNPGSKPKSTLPPQALSQLKEGHVTTFANGQSWTLQNNQPVQVNQPQK